MQTVLEPKMRLNIEPLCNFCFSKMVSALGRQAEAYVCTCGVRWRAVSSYERPMHSEGLEVLAIGMNPASCSCLGHGKMFLEARENGVEVWRCAMQGCSERIEKMTG
jgi:hypothetical protein